MNETNTPRTYDELLAAATKGPFSLSVTYLHSADGNVAAFGLPRASDIVGYPMTLPSASTLTDEQLCVLAAEADGWKHRLATQENPVERDGYRLPNSFGEPIEAWWRDGLPGVFAYPFHYLADANAAKGLLEKDHWDFHWDTSTATVAIFRPEKTYIGEAPDFCRAIVLSFLRAEGKIL